MAIFLKEDSVKLHQTVEQTEEEVGFDLAVISPQSITNQSTGAAAQF